MLLLHRLQLHCLQTSSASYHQLLVPLLLLRLGLVLVLPLLLQLIHRLLLPLQQLLRLTPQST
jgi:hypothetical protein